MMNPLISVIIPVYNVEAYLSKCLESVIGQTYTNLEIILINDGSTDSSGSICDKHALKDGRIKVIHRENGGAASARNAGIDIAKGEFIYFVDSDDYIDKTLCRRVMDVFNSCDADVVAFDCHMVDDNGKKLGSTENFTSDFLVREEAIKEVVKGNINNYLWSKIYKRHILKGVSCPEGELLEDLDMTYKLFLNADKIYCLPLELYYYRQRKNSLSHSITAKKLSDIFCFRKSRYEDLCIIYPQIAQLDFPNVALAARRLYDRSLYDVVNAAILEDARAFLEAHRAELLPHLLYRVYFTFPGLYNSLRRAKHAVGCCVRRMKKLLNR